MIARRQFIQSLLSALAVLSLPTDSRALPSPRLVLLEQDPENEGLPPAIEETATKKPQIKVVGVGGGGSNAVHHMIAFGMSGVEYVFANTDTEALNRCGGHRTIQLHRRTLSANTELGRCRETAELAANDIRSAIEGADMLFIAVGMGGGTGTQAAPVIARIAREMGILTVAVVTMPFSWEGVRRTSCAHLGVAELQANVDSLIVVPNDKLEETLGDCCAYGEALDYVNELLKTAVGGILEMVNAPSGGSFDFQDVRTILSMPGKAVMGTAASIGPDRARLAAEQAVSCPLLDGIALSDAKGVLIVITAAEGTLRFSDTRLAMKTIRAHTSPATQLICSTTYDKSLKDEIRVTVVATGLNLSPCVAMNPREA